jgi:hypothetical protein
MAYHAIAKISKRPSYKSNLTKHAENSNQQTHRQAINVKVYERSILGLMPEHL